jgi:hypothetical protein
LHAEHHADEAGKQHATDHGGAMAGKQ